MTTRDRPGVIIPDQRGAAMPGGSMRAALILGVAVSAVLTGALLAALAPSVAVQYGLPDLGPIVDAGLPAARVVAVGAAALSIGNLLLAAVLAPGDVHGVVSPSGYAGLRAAARWALVQAVASAVVTGLLVAENSGVPPQTLAGRLDVLVVGVGQIQQAGGWAVSALAALAVAVLAALALSWRSAVGLFVLAMAALLPVTLTAATNAERSHDIAGDAVTLHVLAAVLWLGSTAATAVHLARRGPAADVVLRRHRTVAHGALVVVAASGVVSAAYALAPSDVFTSGYGWLAVVGVLAVPLLALATHRLAAVGPGIAGRRAALRVVAVELVLLALAFATGTALTRVPPPSETGYEATRYVYLIGYDLPAHLTAADLAMRWRPDLVFGPLAVLGAVAYLIGVRRLRRAGGEWPAGRTVAWLAGCVTVLVATCSGIATYGAAVFSVHMVEHMLLATLAPVLLVLGHGVTLALRVAEPGPAARLLGILDSPGVRFVRHPVVGWLAVAATLFGLYPTGLYAAIVQEHWAHLAMNVAFFVTGLALFWPVLGRSLPSRALPAIARIVMVFAVMALHAGFSVWLLGLSAPVAGGFYGALQLPYVPNLLADQRLGAVLAWVLAELPVILAVLALVARWARDDRAPRTEPETSYPDRFRHQRLERFVAREPG
ncbi:cytochrome c oxidase assembly protein [Pseudonocardia sp. CA-142604]|uniref:cytochrome c oxidase assembly protein n=1 Tax=Pseudonocardia sp. CA-142604 TaxID=3240024 RepID=UPI003D9313C1